MLLVDSAVELAVVHEEDLSGMSPESKDGILSVGPYTHTTGFKITLPNTDQAHNTHL